MSRYKVVGVYLEKNQNDKYNIMKGREYMNMYNKMYIKKQKRSVSLGPRE
jgi:hypothetical protein